MAEGGRGAMAPLEFRSSNFSEILRFCRKITDFGLAQSTFSLDLFASLSVLPTTSALFVIIS